MNEWVYLGHCSLYRFPRIASSRRARGYHVIRRSYRGCIEPVIILSNKGFRLFSFQSVASVRVAAQMPRLLFTGLEDYKIRGSQASPYLVVTHYDELAESKDIVLVRGDIILPNHLKDAEVRLNP
jgi:ATP synthase F1 complex assembly factor 1